MKKLILFSLLFLSCYSSQALTSNQCKIAATLCGIGTIATPVYGTLQYLGDQFFSTPLMPGFPGSRPVKNVFLKTLAVTLLFGSGTKYFYDRI